MGRLITFESTVQDTLSELVSNRSSHIGLIIGQCTAQRDLVLRLCPTPQNVESETTSDISESGGDAKQKGGKDGSVSGKKSGGPDLDEPWICQHAKQVTRALPGGLDVLGLYFVASAEVANNLQPKLRQILLAIYKTLSKDQKLSVNEHISDRILLHICPVTLKCACKTLNILDYKNPLNPADWKPSTGVSYWHKLECKVAVDFKFPVKRDHGNLSLQKQIELGLNPYFKEVLGAVPLISGASRKLEEFLDTLLSEGKKTKRKEKSEHRGHSYNVELFLPLDPRGNGENCEVLECVTMMTFKGNIQCRAFVHSRATVKEAIQAIKQDVIRSITARCNIHCEDLLLIDEEQRDPLVVYELPRRVFAPLPQSEIFVSDYQFHGDSASDSLDAFKELLNLDVTEDDVETACEVSPIPSLLIQPEVMEDRLSEFGDAPSSSTNILVPVASATIAALAAGLSYFLFLQEK